MGLRQGQWNATGHSVLICDASFTYQGPVKNNHPHITHRVIMPINCKGKIKTNKKWYKYRPQRTELHKRYTTLSSEYYTIFPAVAPKDSWKTL